MFNLKNKNKIVIKNKMYKKLNNITVIIYVYCLFYNKI